MEKKNRVEFLEDQVFRRAPRAMVCSFCHEPGHNVRTCRQASASSCMQPNVSLR